MSLASLEAAATQPQAEQSYNFLEGLGRSFAAGFPEMIGVRPSQPVQRWRAAHPVAALGADIATFMVPYGGWLKVANKLPLMNRALRVAGSIENPAMAGFAKEIVRFAPFEALRVGATATAGQAIADEGEFTGVGTETKHAAINVLGAGVLGGGFGALGAFGRRLGSSGARPGANIGGTMQEQIQQLEKNLPQATDPAKAREAIAQLRDAVRSEKAPKGSVYIDALEDIEDASAVKDLNRLFAPTKAQGRAANIKQLLVGTEANRFASRAELDALEARVGLKDTEGFIQAPRMVQPLREGAGRSIGHAVRRALTGLGDGWFWGKDTGDGLYVMARRLEGKPQVATEVTDAEVAKRLHLKAKGNLYLGGVEDNKSLRRAQDILRADGEDISKVTRSGWLDHRGRFTTAEPKKAMPQWVLFKTSNPGHFLPEHKAFADAASERAGVFGRSRRAQPASEDINAPTSVHDTVARLRNEGMVDYRGLIAGGSHQEAREKVLKALKLDGLKDSELARRVTGGFDAIAAPTMFQFRNHPAAAWLVFGAKQAQQQASAVAEKLFLGHRLNSPGATPWSVIFSKPTAAADSIDRLVDDLFVNPESVAAFQRTVLAGVDVETGIREYGLSPRGRALLHRLEEIDAFQVESIQATQKLVGEKGFKPKPFHYMLSRFWDGTWRVPITEGNRTIGFGAGKSRAAAIKHAESITAENAAWQIRRPQLISEEFADMRLVAGINEQDARRVGAALAKRVVGKTPPKRLVKQRKGARGYKGDIESWTKQDVKSMILRQLQTYQGYNAKISFEHQFADVFDRLKAYAPDIAEQATARTRAVFGEPGQVAKAIDKAVDRFLAPVMGANSATKLAGETNKLLFRGALGFFNTGFNVANALTFVQTAYPHISMLATAPPARLMPYYTMWPVQGLKSAGAVGMLDMMKLTGRSFQRLTAAGDEDLRVMVERAVADGTIAPRFVEAWVGQKAQNLVKFREVLQGKEPVMSWIGSVADAMPSATEKFARGHSFVLGQTFFKEIMGVEDKELLYQLSKRFVENTQFLYGTEDRAKIITGPLGSSFGLFKNWMMHYLGWWAKYTGEAFGKGNWGPLMWAGGSTAALGGVGAVPLFGAADAFSRWMGNPSALVQLNELFGDRKDMADGLYYGLPSFAGFSLQNQVAAPFANIGEDTSRFFNFAIWDRMKYIGKFGGQLVDNYQATGQGPGHDQRTTDLFMRAFAPKSLYQLTQAAQEGAIRSLSSGNPVADVSLPQRLMLAASLGSPMELAKRFQIGRELWEDQNAMRNAVSQYGRAWADSVEARRYKETLHILQRAAEEGVDLSRVVKSGMAFQAKGRENAIERQFSLSSTKPYRDAGLI